MISFLQREEANMIETNTGSKVRLDASPSAPPRKRDVKSCVKWEEIDAWIESLKPETCEDTGRIKLDLGDRRN